MPNVPFFTPQQPEFGVHKDQTLLKTTKVLHEKENDHSGRPWFIYAEIAFSLVILIGILLFILFVPKGADKAALAAFRQANPSPAIQNSAAISFSNKITVDTLIEIAPEEFSWMKEDLTGAKIVNIAYQEDGFDKTVTYFMAKIVDQWFVAWKDPAD